MSTEVSQAHDERQFLEYLREGTGPLTAALAVGWSPTKLRRMMADPEFAELVEAVKIMKIEAIEQVVFGMANRGNFRAAQMVLMCQASDRGWRPPATRVDVSRSSKIEVSLVSSVVEAARQVLEANDPAALQPGSALDDIVDAEVIDG